MEVVASLSGSLTTNLEYSKVIAWTLTAEDCTVEAERRQKFAAGLLVVQRSEKALRQSGHLEKTGSRLKKAHTPVEDGCHRVFTETLSVGHLEGLRSK